MEGSLPPQGFDRFLRQERVIVDPVVRKFFLDTEQLRADLVAKQSDVAKIEQEIVHREEISAKLAPDIELCYACKGSGKGHSYVRTGHFGPMTPPCVHCQGNGFRKKAPTKAG